jgi:hypothetical protein
MNNFQKYLSLIWLLICIAGGILLYEESFLFKFVTFLFLMIPYSFLILLNIAFEQNKRIKDLEEIIKRNHKYN